MGGKAERVRVPDRRRGRRAVEAASQIGGLARGIAAPPTPVGVWCEGRPRGEERKTHPGGARYPYVAAACVWHGGCFFLPRGGCAGW
jgi:hypothetical protein